MIGKTWFTSNLMLGDKNATSERGFGLSIDRMDEAIITRWNELVQPNHTVWILGGLATWADPQWQTALNRAVRLNGRKHLLAGSTDRCLAESVNLEENVRQYRDRAELRSVITGAAYLRKRVLIQIPLMGGPSHGYPCAVLSPFCWADNDSVDDGLRALMPVRKPRSHQARNLICGDAPFVTQVFPGAQPYRCVNVSMDEWGLEPVPADVIVSLLTDA